MAPLTSLWACSRRSCLLTLSLHTRSQAELSSIRSDCKLDVSPSDLLMISLADFWTNATVVARAPSSCWNACKAREECWQCGALQTLSTLIIDLVTHAGLCWSINQTWGCDGVVWNAFLPHQCSRLLLALTFTKQHTFLKKVRFKKYFLVLLCPLWEIQVTLPG